MVSQVEKREGEEVGFYECAEPRSVSGWISEKKSEIALW